MPTPRVRPSFLSCSKAPADASRHVLQCAICRAPSEHVRVTRYTGKFTQRWAEDQALEAEPGTQFYAPMGAYFDASAAEHCAEIRAKSLLRCPLSLQAQGKRVTGGADVQGGGGDIEATRAPAPGRGRGGRGRGGRGRGRGGDADCGACRASPFTRMQDFSNHLRSHKLSLCKLCCEGRKCFPSEQRVYTKAELDKHLKDGEQTEEDGRIFHPECSFCVKRFYDENALYSHMHKEHYTCHLCARVRSEAQFEYYPSYAALETHFRQKHCLCEHPDCLEKKFVVFTNEHELKRHAAAEHGGDMTGQQRRREANLAPDIAQAFFFQPPRERGGRFRRGGEGGGDDAHSDDDVERFAGAGNGSAVGGMAADRPIFSEADPSLAEAHQGGGGGGRAPDGRPAGWVAAGSATHQRPDVNDGEQFPSLPPAAPGGRRGGRHARGGSSGGRGVWTAAAAPPRNRNVTPLGDRPAMQPAMRRNRSAPALVPTQGNPFASAPRPGAAAPATPQTNSFAPTPRAPVPDTRSLKERGQALASRLKQEVGNNAAAMNTVRTGLRAFQKGEVDAHVLVTQLAELRLAHLVPDIAAVCPVQAKRDELAKIYKDFSKRYVAAQRQAQVARGGAQAPAPQQQALAPRQQQQEEQGQWRAVGRASTAGGARAASSSMAARLASAESTRAAQERARLAAKADARAGWACTACTLHNPSWRAECGVCGTPRYS